jgi:alginate O-acetyltransferase complex protein AlgI
LLFNSVEFLLFLPVVFFLYWFVFHRVPAWQNVLILAASYFFYAWWSWQFLGLLFLSTLLDYLYGFQVASLDRRRAKIFLWLSVVNNLGILGVFKYYDFFALEFQQLFDSFGIHTNPVLLNVALPIGISFYTFHGMSYVFDIYRGRQKPISNLVDYAVFVSFFPLLVAGPIERANHLLPQVLKRREFDYTQAVDGCKLILWGMFKKIVIADNLARVVDKVFDNYQDFNGVSLVLAAIAFSVQIYCDFSGYSDIALGTAKLFGFELLSNFKFPYFSRNVAEFWRRWHISLSSWFRDYLYIPLGGSTQGKAKTVRNIFIIFLVSGFWHGASWNFLVWGAIHAFGILPLVLLDRNRTYVSNVVAEGRYLPRLKELFQMVITFSFVTFAWIFFRASDLHHAVSYLKRIFVSIATDPRQLLSPPAGKVVMLYIIPFVIIDWLLRHDERKLTFPLVGALPRVIRFAFYNLAILAMVYLVMTQSSEGQFIYFQF